MSAKWDMKVGVYEDKVGAKGESRGDIEPWGQAET